MKESDKKKIGEAYLRLHSCNKDEGMTNEEAINTLKSLKDYYNDKNEDSYVGFDNEDNEALYMAIKALEIELLTDTEQRIFLSAMRREREICQEVDDEYPDNDSKVSLVKVCDSIERKVKKIWER